MTTTLAAPFYTADGPKVMAPMTAYGVVHYLLRKQRGPARDYLCSCGAPARHWAYDHEDPFERIDPMVEPPKVFSVNFEHYHPMCAPCHSRLDAPYAARKLPTPAPSP